MAEMSMNKVIHRAVRRDLNRFVRALAAFPDGNRARATQLATAWANFDFQLTHHHEGEHEIAWPALEAVGVSREVLAQMDAEHETMAAALTDARASIAALSRSASASDAATAHTAFQRLRDVTIIHLDHEEAEIEPVFLANEDTPAIKEMGKKFSKVSPAQGGQFFAWLTDGAGPEEMAAIKSTVPGPVITIIGGIFGRGYRKNVATVWK